MYGNKRNLLQNPQTKILMSKFVYQISVSNPAKADKRLYRACFPTIGLAADTLRLHGFMYYEDSELWHNGSTEAWITRIPILNTVIHHEDATILEHKMLSEVQLR